MAKLRLLAATLLALCLPAHAQTSTAPQEWCVSTTFAFAPSGCNRATPDAPDKPITDGKAARRELVAQADALLKAGLVSPEKYASELKRISLTAPTSGEDYKPWTFRTGKRGYYVRVTVDQPALREQP